MPAVMTTDSSSAIAFFLISFLILFTRILIMTKRMRPASDPEHPEFVFHGLSRIPAENGAEGSALTCD